MAITSKTLFHYTNSAIAATIIQNRKIRLSPSWHLNDPREGKDFPELLEAFSIAKGRPAGWSTGPLKKFDYHFYVACFSEDGDVLSQWRAYASDATGISLGFDREVLFSVLNGQSELVARPVEYADVISDLKTADSNSPPGTIHLPSAGEAYKALDSILTHGENGTLSPEYLQTLAKIRFAVKRKAYSEEKELRLMYTPTNHNSITKTNNAILKRQYFGGLDAIRDYYELAFDEIIWPKLLTHIFLGPKNTSQLSVFRDFLDFHGLHSTKINTSAAHYR